MSSRFENEEFWEWTYPYMFSPERWVAAAESLNDLATLLNLTPPAPLLDLCCGPGRFSIPLAIAGFDVTAVDRTPRFLAEIDSRVRERGLDVEIVPCDMREFRRPGAFDAALSMFTSFGYFDDPADDRRVLENVYASLRPGGRFLMELGGREPLVRQFQKRDWTESDGLTLLEERYFYDSFRLLHNRWIVFRGQERREWQFELRIYGAVDLRELLQSAGFSSVDTFGDLQGAPYDLAAKRLVVVATK